MSLDWIIDRNNDWNIDNSEVTSFVNDLRWLDDTWRREYIDLISTSEELKETTKSAFENRLWDIKFSLLDWKQISRWDVLVLQSYAILFQWKQLQEVNLLITSIVWPDFNFDNIDLSTLPPELSEQIRNSWDLSILLQVFTIWSEKAQIVAEDLWFKWARNDDNIILWKIKEIKEHLVWLVRSVNEWWKIEKSDLERVFEMMEEAEDQEYIIDDTFEWDVDWIRDLILDDSIWYEDKKYQVFNRMRDWFLDDWNSKWVSDVVWDSLLRKPKFKDVADLLNDEKFINWIFDNLGRWCSESDLIKLWLSESVAEIVFDKYEQLKVSAKSQEEIVRDKIIKANPELSKDRSKLDDMVQDTLELSVNYLTLWVLKQALLEEFIEKNNLQWTDIWTELYTDINWIWTREFSDETQSNIWSLIGDVALLIIPLWVWVLAAKSLSWASRLAKLQWLSKWWEAIRRMATTTIEWVWFYEWYIVANNVIYKDIWNWWDIVHGRNDWSEVLKSIAFIWVMKSLWWIIAWLWIKEVKWWDKIPNEVLVKMLNESTRTLVTWTALTATWYWLEAIARQLWDETSYPDLTWKEFVEMVALAGIYRQVDQRIMQVKLRSNENWLQIQWENVKQAMETRTRSTETVKQWIDFDKLPEASREFYSRYPFLREHYEFLWNIEMKSVMWEWNNAIVLAHPVNNWYVVKIAKPWKVEMLRNEFDIHKSFYDVLEEAKWNNPPPWVENIKIPYVEWWVAKNWWYFIIERINWQSLTTAFYRDYYKKELSTYSKEYLDWITDWQFSELMVKEWLHKVPSMLFDWDFEWKIMWKQMKQFLDRHTYWTPLWQVLNYLENSWMNHWDLHTWNIMIWRNWNIYLIDFGKSEIKK